MAFTATPTSGESPYTITIDLANKSQIDGVNYDLVVRFITTVGSCAVPTNQPSANARDALLNNGVYVRLVDVPEGSCQVFKADIINVATSEIISTQSVSIDNLE